MSASILIDGNNLGIASHFANDKLTDADGRPSGAIYGFLRSIKPMLVRVQEEVGIDKVPINVAWDSQTCWRKELLPSYKASRGDKTGEPDEAMQRYVEQVPRLRDILKTLGVGQMRADNYEADDIAGYIASLGGRLTLITNDKDWLQLVSERVHVWQPLKQRYVTLANFEEVTGCEDTEQFVKVKAICGDKGDDVPGAVGIGEKGAISYVRGEMAPTTKAGKPAAKFKKIEDWMNDPDGYDRSLKLVDLRDIVIPPGNWQLTEGKFVQDALLDHFMALGFNSMLDNLSTWLAPFRKSFT